MHPAIIMKGRTISILVCVTGWLVANNKTVLAKHVRSNHLSTSEMNKDITFDNSPRRLSHHDIHNIISSFDAQNKATSIINPKFGSGLSSLVSGNSLDGHVRRLNGSNKIHLDITFTSPIDNDQAKAALGSVADLEVINCFKSVCSVSVPIDKLEEVTTIEQVHIVNRAQPMSNVLDEKSVRRSLAGSVTSQGDRAMYADQARARFAVDGSGIVIGVIGDSFNCKGGAMNDTLTGDLPMKVTILRDLNATQCQQNRFFLWIKVGP
jgi:hypothetical protein